METSIVDNDVQVIDAREVYLLMKNDYRISRNSRATWYFNHLNGILETKKLENTDDLHKEIEVLSVLAKTIQATADTGRDVAFRLTPQSFVTFLAKRYRLVFILDVSPSSANVDLHLNETLCAEELRSLQTILTALVHPFSVPGSNLILQPELYVSVVAHTSLITCNSNQVLIQGVLLTGENVVRVLVQVEQQLCEFESAVAACLAQVVDTDATRYEVEEDEDDQRLTGGLFDDIVERPSSPNTAQYVVTPDASFVNMLRYAILGLQLLPENSAAGIVIITDGIVGLPDAVMFESLMNQLRHSTIECSFVKIGSDAHKQAGLGHIPYKELMQFIALATFGAYFSKLPHVPEHTDGSYPMNAFHSAFLTWSFQKSSVASKIDDYKEPPVEDLAQNLVWTHRVPGFGKSNLPQWFTPLMKKKHGERNPHTAISNLISCRLREGYTISEVTFSKGDSQIEVKLMLPWRDNVRIVYSAVSAWPLSTAKRHSHVEITIEASYDFLQDSVRTTTVKSFRSKYRTALIRKYLQTLQGMADTDQLLVHLQSFASQPVYYNVPESLRQGVPLFYFPPNSSPQVNQQLSTKDLALNQFASFWKMVLMLDVNTWQKWMHSHRIGMVLEHDKPLGRHLHIPNSSGRFNSIYCNLALTALNFFLRDWCTFVLMENHSYIKLLFGETDKPPSSFYVVRIVSKPPCLVLRVAFLGGTAGETRNQIVNELKEALAKLHLPQRGSGASKDDKERQRRQSKHDTTADHNHRPPLQRLWSETSCCIFVTKPMEKILMRYDRMPHDFSTVELPPVVDHSGQLTQITSANKASASAYLTLSKYLYHRRWVWSVQHSSNMPLSMQAVGRVLSTLTKMRLQEGFNFAHANSGIINMAVELQLKNPDVECDNEAGRREEQEEEEEVLPCLDGSLYPCIMQYIVFPPHITTTKDSMCVVDEGEEEEEEETTEADGELQIITECWVEPQHGHVIFSTPERKHFDGLTYHQLPHAVHPADYECISTMLTFEHLNLMCQSISVAPPSTISGSKCSSPSLPRSETRYSPTNSSIQHVPFPFDVMCLLPKCQQVELLFSTFIQDPDSESPRTLFPSSSSNIDLSSPNNLLFSMFLDQLGSVHDRQLTLTHAECLTLISIITARDKANEKTLPFSFQSDEDRDGEGREQEGKEDGREGVQDSSEGVHRSDSGTSLSTKLTNMPITSSSLTGHSVIGTNSLGSVRAAGNFQDLSRQPSSTLSSLQLQQVQVVKSSSLTMARGSSPFVAISDGVAGSHGIPELTECTKPVPRWQCFVKSVTSTHVMLCFVPASYADLKLLVNGIEKEDNEKSSPDLGPKETERRGSVVAPEPPKVVHSLERKPSLDTFQSELLLSRMKAASDSQVSSGTLKDDNVGTTSTNIEITEDTPVPLKEASSTQSAPCEGEAVCEEPKVVDTNNKDPKLKSPEEKPEDGEDEENQDQAKKKKVPTATLR